MANARVNKKVKLFHILVTECWAQSWSRCMSANMANSAIHSYGVNKWVVSQTQAFATRICVVAPPGECLQVKADMVLCAGNTVWSISERVRGVREDALYKSTLPLRHLGVGVLSLCHGEKLLLGGFTVASRCHWLGSRTPTEGAPSHHRDLSLL